MDAAYQAKFLPMARLLWEASQGNPSGIPLDYAEHLHHTYADGSVSLAPILPLMEDYSELEDFEIEEAIEFLGKVNPEDWPNIDDIEGFSAEDLIKVYDESSTVYEFVEDNLTAGERTERVLEQAISSVFGAKVSKIRNQKGHEPNIVNKFLQETDGTFRGTFEWEGHQFLFELYPDESGWVLTYRLAPKSLDALPAIPQKDQNANPSNGRRLRHRGWN